MCTTCSCSRTHSSPLCGWCGGLDTLIPQIRSTVWRAAAEACWRLTQEDCEDLTQEVLRCLARAKVPQNRLRFIVSHVARCRVIDWIDCACRRPRLEFRAEFLDTQPSRSEAIDVLLSVMEAMDRMTDEMRRVFYARGIEQRTREETVELLGLSLHEVRCLYEQAIAIAAEVLKERP